MPTLETRPARKRTARQQEASRRNRAQSKGPKTEAGKQKSSGNAWLTGLYSEKILITRLEKTERFQELLNAFEAEWQPAGPTEAALVRSLAAESLLLDRWRSLEAAALDSIIERTDPADPNIFSSPATLLEQATAGLEIFLEHGFLPNLQTIERAIASADRTFRSSLASLIQFRKNRPAAQPVPEPIPVEEPKTAPPPAPAPEEEGTNLSPSQPFANQKVAGIAEPRKSFFPGFTPDVFKPTPVRFPFPNAPEVKTRS